MIRLKATLFLSVAVFTFILRAHNYERVPTANHLDEMLYAWSGLNLIETGTPISWSTLTYPKKAEVFRGEMNYLGGIPSANVTLYKPWLDEPPFFSLLVGEFAHIFHADRNGFIPSTYIRFPMIFVSCATSIMIFLIGRKISGFWIGLLSMLLYGTIPIFVFASRTAMPETLIAFLFSLVIYLVLKFKENSKTLYLAPIPIIVGIAGLSKPTGFLIIFYGIFMVFWIKRPGLARALKYSIFFILATIPFVIAYLVYGFGFDREIFLKILSEQSFRPVGFSSLIWFLISPSYSTSILKDGWYSFALASAMYFLFKKKSESTQTVLFAFVFWIMVVMLSGGEADLLAWYRFPSFPMLSIITAWGVVEVVKKADFFVSFVAVGLWLGVRSLIVNAFHPNVSTYFYRFVFLMLLLPSAANLISNKKVLVPISRCVLIVVFVVGIYLNVYFIYNAFGIECQSKTCAIVPSNFVSSLHFPIFWRLLEYK